MLSFYSGGLVRVRSKGVSEPVGCSRPFNIDNTKANPLSHSGQMTGNQLPMELYFRILIAMAREEGAVPSVYL